jgi:hypothetical protein
MISELCNLSDAYSLHIVTFVNFVTSFIPADSVTMVTIVTVREKSRRIAGGD